MKKIIFFLLISGFSSVVFSQATEKDMTKARYVVKSHNQRTTARILLGGGALMTGTGLIVSLGQGLGNLFTPQSERSSTGEVLTVIGLTSMAASIPFFIASASNKKKSLGISFKNEPAILIYKGVFTTVTIPSINLKLQL